MNNNTIVAETSPIVRDLIAAIEAHGNDSVYLDRDHPWYPNISEPITRPAPKGESVDRIEWCAQTYTPAGERISLADLPAGWWETVTEGIAVSRNCGAVTRLHGGYMHVSYGFYILDKESAVEGASTLKYVSEVWLREEMERAGVEYLTAHPELVTERPGWAQTVEAIVEPDGTVDLSYEADFGSLTLGASAAFKDGEFFERFGPVKYILSNEERTSAGELRDMAADFLRAAAALERSEPTPLVALPPVSPSTCETYDWCDFDHAEAPGVAMHIKPHNDGLLRFDFVLDETASAPGLTPFRRSSRYESRPVVRGRGQGDWSDHDEQQEASHPGAGRP